VALAPFLDGRRTLGEVIELAAARAPLPTLFSALAQLESKDCLGEGEPLADPKAAAFWDGLGIAADRVGPALDAGIAIQSFDVEADTLRRRSSATGCAVSAKGVLRWCWWGTT